MNHLHEALNTPEIAEPESASTSAAAIGRVAMANEFRDDNLAPVQLCLSLWADGFLNAAFLICFTLDWLLPSAVLILQKTLREPPLSETAVRGLLTLTFGVCVFGFISAVLIALLIVLRGAFIRFSSSGFSLIVLPSILVCIFLVARVSSHMEVWLMNLSAVNKFATITLSLVLMSLVLVLKWASNAGRRSGIEQGSLRPRIVSSWWARFRITISWVNRVLMNYVTGCWVPDLQERVTRIRERNDAVRSTASASLADAGNMHTADISADFKAWTDTTKLFLTVATGFSVALAVLDDGTNPHQREALRISAVLFVLVPGLACAYMEVFKRQCERCWKTMEASPADTPNVVQGRIEPRNGA